MAMGDSYATLPELKARFSITDDTRSDAALLAALQAASRGIELVCDRQFNIATEATPRVYHADFYTFASVDDFHTTADLAIATDEDGDGVFEQPWTAADYQLEPLNGINEGQPGWPFSKIRAVGSRAFRCGRRASLQVTAQWGWTAVPAPVRDACLIVAGELFKLKEAPFGVAGFTDYGAVRVRENPVAMKQLSPYVRYKVLVG
jgi:hypothetical protein